jgi:serine phosphatase RsbU (regulator of sigma subunit)
LVVGVYSQGDTTVYVSETLENIRRTVIGDVILRLIGLVILAFVATAVVDYVLWRVIWRPIRRLVVTVQEIAKGNLGVQAKMFRSRELGYLSGEINAMSTSLAAVDRERASQMVKAREIQQSLLPKNVDVAGLKLSSLFLPAEEVAGDYFDIITLQDGTHVVCVADVTGHGVPAALSAMMLKVLLVEACERNSDPSDILEFINRRLTGVCRTDGFVTMFVARFDTQAMTLHYASAGHESGLLLPAEGELTELTSTGMILGVMEDESWTTRTMAVHPGDRLLLVTDGVTEAMNPREQMFGRKKLADSFNACRDTDMSGTLERIGSEVADYCENRPYSDDVTLLALEVTADRPSGDLQRIGNGSLESARRL